MNNASNPNDRMSRGVFGVKVVALICVVGSIVLIEHQTPFTSSDFAAPGMTSLVAPSEATAMTTDSRDDVNIPSASSPDGAPYDRSTAAPRTGFYPEPAANAVCDEDGHPSSF